MKCPCPDSNLRIPFSAFCYLWSAGTMPTSIMSRRLGVHGALCSLNGSRAEPIIRVSPGYSKRGLDKYSVVAWPRLSNRFACVDVKVFCYITR